MFTVFIAEHFRQSEEADNGGGVRRVECVLSTVLHQRSIAARTCILVVPQGLHSVDRGAEKAGVKKWH